MTRHDQGADMPREPRPDDQDEDRVIEPEGDDLHLGAQAHFDMGPEAQKQEFGKPMSPDEGDDIHGGTHPR